MTHSTAELERLASALERWIEAGPNNQPHYTNGVRPFSTGDLKAFTAAIRAAADRVQHQDRLREALKRIADMTDIEADFDGFEAREIANRALTQSGNE